MDNLDMSANFHRWWILHVTQPIFLAVDSILSVGNRMNMKTYVGIPTTGSLEAIYGGEGVSSAFFLLEIPMEITTWSTERAARKRCIAMDIKCSISHFFYTVDVVQQAKTRPEKEVAINDDVGSVIQVTDDMLGMLNKVQRYVNDVIVRDDRII